MPNYWDERRFQRLHADYCRQPTFALAETITADFFVPLAREYLRGGEVRLRNADPEEVAQIAAIRCFEKLDRYDATRGGAFGYFTKLCHRVALSEEIRATVYASRHVSADAPVDAP